MPSDPIQPTAQAPSPWSMAVARARALGKQRAIIIGGLITLSGGIALTQTPLFAVPGYELASAMTMILAIFSGLAGVFGGVQEGRYWREVGQGRCALIGDSGLGGWSTYLATCGISLVVATVPLLVAVARTAISTRCSPWSGAPFYLLLPLPTILLASATGLGIGLVARRAWMGMMLYLLVLVLSISFSLWPLWSGPQVFALNHYAGYFPGPLYDEVLPLESRLLTYRGYTLVWTALILLATMTALKAMAQGWSWRRWRQKKGKKRAIGLLVLSLAAVTGWIYDFELGWQTRPGDLQSILSGRAQTEHFVLHFPRQKSAQEIKRLERDVEFRYQQVKLFLGIESANKIEAWFYENREQKRRLVGASQTSFAKPWRHEFHVQDEPFPHPLIGHEMAHVVAREFGSPLFKISARHLIEVNMGLVEGVAVAAQPDEDELTIHQWAAAMRRLKLAAPMQAIVGSLGFYSQAPARAYTLAGSFLRFLAQRHGGAEKLRALYPAGDFEAAYGQNLSSLVAEWESFLDRLPLDARALHVAQVRFERPSIFQRPCARELASLSQAAEQLRTTDAQASLGLFRRCAQIEPSNPAHLRAQATLLKEQKDYQAARQTWERVLNLPGGTTASKVQALMGIGDLAWMQDHFDQARAAFAEALALHRDRATDRMAAIKMEALNNELAQPVLRGFFASSPDIAQILALEKLAVAQPTNATARYLIGRQLFLHHHFQEATVYLAQTLELKLASDELKRETLRLLSQAYYLTGDGQAARRTLSMLANGGDATDQEFARNWESRCAFEEQMYGGLLNDE